MKEIQLPDSPAREVIALEQLGALWDVLDDGVLLFHQYQGLVYFNAQAQSILGISTKNLLHPIAENQEWAVFQVDGSPFPWEKNPLRISYQTGASQRGIRMGVHCPNGSYVWLVVSTQRVLIQDQQYVLSIFHRDTEHMAVSLHEQYANQFFSKSFVHNTTIGIAFVGIDGKWLEVNQALQKMLGYGREELLALTFQDITHEEDLLEGIDLLTRMLDNQLMTYQLEKRYVHKDGSTLWALVSVTLIRNNNQTPRFFISRIIDITEHKRMLEMLESQNQALQQNRQLLQKQIQQLLDFNQIVAHNLRGPASSIQQICYLLELDLPRQQHDQLTQQIPALASQLLQTLDDVQKTITIPKVPSHEVEPCDLKHVLAKVKEKLSHSLAENQAIVQEFLRVRMIPFPADYLEMILLTLLGNALEFRSESPPRIRIRTSRQGNYVALSIIDNGIGIDLKRYGHQLFKYQKRFHAHSSGSGKGLFYVKNQVEAFGGYVKIKSELGKGTRVSVYFQTP